MKKSLIFITALFTFLTQNVLANTTLVEKPAENSEIKKSEVMVGFYGRPYTPSLGILGESPIDNVVVKLREKGSYYTKELGENFDIQLAFHLIYGLATKDPGKNDDYIINLPHKTVMKYIERAQKEGFAVIIDLQLGVYTPYEALQPVLKYLKYDNVHLALDPEFKIPKHRKYPPGKFIGHIFGDDVNQAQELISNYLKENGIKEKKKLIVHMFHERMLRKKELVKNYDNIELIYNIDGHGRGGIKVQIYNNLYSQDESLVANSGFKIFYKNDKKPLMTPKQILGLESVGTRNIKRQPYYINYH
ncbi:hypothetical protein [Halarcobacter bivalviorum]|uniref:Uncharacterized protein n=1 Tax=Halarcobacter bivalviorum TaxID=663364 RepID=A0AAX2ACN0_9BACT|nr:hypothetical protein [Halarcobacter bivalviorum]AXH11723.1 hypothetical protein ABIV_0710 [Halarcobacter bivalviorum]RXK10853.1 hypothetical protein CRV05_00335 [Halarcobacter bivalviorum]